MRQPPGGLRGRRKKGRERKRKKRGGAGGGYDRRRTHNFKSQRRAVRDDDGAEEVVTVGIGRQRDARVGHGDAVEVAEAVDGDGLLKVDAVLAGDAGDADLGVAADADLDGVVDEQVLVEGGEGVDVDDLGELADVDGGQARARRRGEGDARKGRLGRRRVGEVHLALEGVQHGVDAVVGRDGGVDGEGEVGRLRLGDLDAVDLELGAVDARLGDLGDGDEYSVGEGQKVECQ